MEWLVCIPWIGGREPTRCAVCSVEILTPDDIKQCKFGRKPDIVHKTCWNVYTSNMSEMTTHEAAVYLAEHGYTVGRRRIGGSGPPSAATIKRWCQDRKLKARKSGWVWLVEKEELDRLLVRNGTT